MLAAQPVEGQALFVDMNSFFASVEQETKPELRGKPVGVLPYLTDTTCVIAASIEAKQFGVKTGTLVPEARRLCPGILFLADNAATYRDYHRRIMAELDNLRCQITIKSIDEAYLRVPRDLTSQARQLADEVKSSVRRVGSTLRCSVGVAPNLFLAKMGTNLRKPDGLLEIRLADLEGLYATLRLTDLHGISWRLERRLHAIGINTSLELYHAPYSLLKRTFGLPGEAWYLRLRGYEVDERPTHRSQIGHQNTIVPEPARTRTELMTIASGLTYKVAAGLRREDFAARSVGVFARTVHRQYWFNFYRGHTPFTDSATLYQHVERLLERLSLSVPIRLLGVTATDLLPAAALPQSLFDAHRHSEALSAAIDQMGAKYGRGTIIPARQLIGAPMKDSVGFGNAKFLI
jgi:DNA polymerase-4